MEGSQAWDHALLTLPDAHVLQTAEWAAFKARHGWQPRQVLIQEGGEVRAMASVLVRRVRGFPWGIGYAPKGPCLGDVRNLCLWEQVLAALEALARRERLIFLKVDPDVAWGKGEPGQEVASFLRQRGWLPSSEQVQFRNTVALDLRPDPEEILQGMHPKTRYNVRLARRRGVEVEEGGVDSLPEFYRLYQETSQRDGFLIRPFAYYRDLWSTFMAAGLARLFLARHGGDLLAGVITFRFGARAWYVYGASSDRKRNLMSSHLAQWEAMLRARAEGVREYDFWGAPERLDESDPLWGVYRFKAGFGGRFVERIGAYDYPVNRPLYVLYTRVMPGVLGVMRARHTSAQTP
ncbi:MAG: lipid II:glycine glycyltransferase FemX [Anaerolineae bacterium]